MARCREGTRLTRPAIDARQRDQLVVHLLCCQQGPAHIPVAHDQRGRTERQSSTWRQRGHCPRNSSGPGNSCLMWYANGGRGGPLPVRRQPEGLTMSLLCDRAETCTLGSRYPAAAPRRVCSVQYVSAGCASIISSWRRDPLQRRCHGKARAPRLRAKPVVASRFPGLM
jgi:hypothetical protein